MDAIRTVGIVGLGLIGGSLARDLAHRGIRVHAYDTDADTLRAALEEGVIEATLDAALGAVSGLDAVVIALPVTAAVSLLDRAHTALSRVPLVTDVCSTKRSVMHAAARAGLSARFIGGHPIAGDHRSGWAASRRGLFAGARVYLCRSTDTAAAPLERLRALWTELGATCELMDSAAHDELLAWASHLPQAASTALARALAGAGVGRERLGPGGRDMTRLAKGSAAVWTPIALDNAAALCAALHGMEAELARLRSCLLREDRGGVEAFFGLHQASQTEAPVGGDRGTAA